MRVGNLELPLLVETLLAEGRWPQEKYYGNGPVAAGGIVEALVPGEQEIWLSPPPLHTIEADNLRWFEQFRRAGDIDFSRAVIIGDFGPGTDAPIVLDFRQDPPSVKALRLRWFPNPLSGKVAQKAVTNLRPEGHWVHLALSLDDFIARIGI
jgi:hypothetical protein